MGMDSITRFVRRLAFWLGARRRDEELAAELEYHRARTQAALEADGIPPAEAALRSRRAMGNVTLAREDARAIWIAALPEQIWNDARYGLRALRREPSFALTALLTLTLGSATTIAVVSVVDAELWRPLPLPSPHELVAVQPTGPGTRARTERVAGADLADWQAQARRAEYAGFEFPARRVLRRQLAESVLVQAVTTNFFDVLRYVPRLGRPLRAADERGPRVAVVSDAGWKRLFAADPATVGRTVTVDDESYEIVGILADARLEFTGGEPDFYVPIDTASPAFRSRTTPTVDVYGRLRPGAQIGEAEAELQTIVARIAAAFPDGHAGLRVKLHELRGYMTGYNSRPLYFFLGAAAVLLVLSCLNVANLLLARALRRQREFAIRGALGGGRAALVRQLLVEGALLAVPGAVFGAIAAVWVIGAFTPYIPEYYLGRGGHIALDGRVAAFVLAVSMVTTVLLALAPMFFARRIDLNVMLAQGGRTAGRSPRQRRTRTALLVGQVTMTVVLLAGAGLFVLSFTRLLQAPLGFDPENRVALRVTLAGSRHAGDAAVVRFAERLLEEGRSTAGVRDATVASSSPLNSGPSVRFVVMDRERPAPGDEPSALVRAISPDYFRTLGTRVLEGREFSATDLPGAPRVAVVNETLARRLSPGVSPLGQRLELLPGARAAWSRRPGAVVIVGVTENVKNVGLNEVAFNGLYLPFAQAPAASMELIVTAGIDLSGMIDPLRTAVARVDPALPVTRIASLTDRVDGALHEDRFNLLLIAFFACAAVVLAAVGIYGALACGVQERTREFGVRLALGARPKTIVRAALWEAARLGMAGGVLGVGATLIIARLLGDALYLVPGEHTGLLYGVKTTDPLALGAALTLAIVVATVSGLMPARHATRVDPLVALRAE